MPKTMSIISTDHTHTPVCPTFAPVLHIIHPRVPLRHRCVLPPHCRQGPCPCTAVGCNNGCTGRAWQQALLQFPSRSYAMRTAQQHTAVHGVYSGYGCGETDNSIPILYHVYCRQEESQDINIKTPEEVVAAPAPAAADMNSPAVYELVEVECDGAGPVGVKGVEGCRCAAHEQRQRQELCQLQRAAA